MNDVETMEASLSPHFAVRLERLRSLTGLSWVAFAREIGVRHERVRRWREGVRPNDKGMESLRRLAAKVPGGLDVLFPGDDQDRGRAA